MKTHRLLSLMLVCCMFMALLVPVGAVGATKHSELTLEIEKFIFDTVYTQEVYDLHNHSSISLGNRIFTYVVKSSGEDGFSIADVQYYPIMDNNTVVGIVGATEVDGVNIFSYSEGYSEQLNSVLQENESIALLGNGAKLSVISAADAQKYPGIYFSNPSAKTALISRHQASYALPSSYSCIVPQKLQESNEMLCWAACTASFGQYYTGINMTAHEVADDLGIDASAGGTPMDVIEGLESIYSLNSNMIIDGGIMSYITICKKICENRPIIAGIESANGTDHMVIIDGYSSGSNYSALMFMEPDGGQTTIALSNTEPITIPLAGSSWEIIGTLWYSGLRKNT